MGHKGGDSQGDNTAAKPFLKREDGAVWALPVPPGSAPAAPRGWGRRPKMSPSCRQLSESSLFFVISLLLSARASARSSRWQKSMFPRRGKYLQISVVFLRAVNNAACGNSRGTADGSSVTARFNSRPRKASVGLGEPVSGMFWGSVCTVLARRLH